MPRATPKVDWSARTELPDDPYDAVDKERIVKAAEGNESRHLSKADCRQLLDVVRQIGRAFLLATHQHLGPTRGEIKASLGRLHRDATKLSQTISALDDATIFALYRQRGEFREAYRDVKLPTGSREKRHVQALSIVPALAAEAKAAIEEVGKERPPADENPLDWIIDWEIDPVYGRPSPIGMMIYRLADLFYEVTGKEPDCKHITAENTYAGDFHDFAGACLWPLEGEPRDAFGKTIQQHLPKWREANGLKA
jgi:hypothetical protein